MFSKIVVVAALSFPMFAHADLSNTATPSEQERAIPGTNSIAPKNAVGLTCSFTRSPGDWTENILGVITRSQNPDRFTYVINANGTCMHASTKELQKVANDAFILGRPVRVRVLSGGVITDISYGQ